MSTIYFIAIALLHCGVWFGSLFMLTCRAGRVNSHVRYGVKISIAMMGMSCFVIGMAPFSHPQAFAVKALIAADLLVGTSLFCFLKAFSRSWLDASFVRTLHA